MMRSRPAVHAVDPRTEADGWTSTAGHGGDTSGVNVGMAGPRLEHVVGALGAAAQGAVQRAWFLFAHAETLLPLQALLGLHGAVSSRGCGRGRGGS